MEKCSGTLVELRPSTFLVVPRLISLRFKVEDLKFFWLRRVNKNVFLRSEMLGGVLHILTDTDPNPNPNNEHFLFLAAGLELSIFLTRKDLQREIEDMTTFKIWV